MLIGPIRELVPCRISAPTNRRNCAKQQIEGTVPSLEKGERNSAQKMVSKQMIS